MQEGGRASEAGEQPRVPAPEPPARAGERERPAGRRGRAGRAGSRLGVALALLALVAFTATAVLAGVAGFGRGADQQAEAALMRRMLEYNEALGVDCTYCHVPGKFAIVTPRMRTTQWMEEHLVGALVSREGHRPIDCRTCHDGRARFLPSSP
ncbi:MAG: hypothetical protein KatS3mg102_0872 [Planctomycetota bacterium]|nr:MAG: hypothetical protein KatS3mg102_0872 [Planctomycetota bacterium]